MEKAIGLRPDPQLSKSTVQVEASDTGGMDGTWCGIEDDSDCAQMHHVRALRVTSQKKPSSRQQQQHHEEPVIAAAEAVLQGFEIH